MTKRRQEPKERKEQLLETAHKMALELGFHAIRRDHVAEAAGVSIGLVNFHFETMANFRRELMRYAIRHESLPIIAEGLAIRDPRAMNAPEDLRGRAADYLKTTV